MGSLVKQLGQWSRTKLPQSESARIFQKLKANKIEGSLSLTLDKTLREGHDLKTFGLGTMAVMASRPRYHQFLVNMKAVYAAMEEELDAASIPAIKTDTIRTVWSKHHEPILRRRERLALDLEELENLNKDDTTVVSTDSPVVRVSPMTLKYLQAIRHAGEVDRETGGGLLLGHLYCRYFADLFGGQMLGIPIKNALQLPQPPRHLQFDLQDVSRRAYLEHLYTDINKAGKMLSSQQFVAVKQEAIEAFQHNAQVYSEPPGMITGAVRGGFNLVLGWATSSTSSSSSK